MSKHRDQQIRTQPSRLGRGLGSLIPVPIKREETIPAANAADSAPPRSQPVERTHGADVADRNAPDQRVESTPRDGQVASAEHEVVFVPLSSLRSGKYQPRTNMDQEAIHALAASIATSGLMQPIVVRRATSEPGAFEVIAGERRWRAMAHLGRTEAPVIIRQVEDQQAAELALVENLQREDLNPMDRATALRRLVEEFGLTHQEVGARVGLDRATVSNLLRLNDLDSTTAQMVRMESLTLGHAKVLLGITDAVRRASLAQRAVQGQWSVRQLEETLASEGANVPRGTSRKPGTDGGRSMGGGITAAHIKDLETALQEHLSTRVSIKLGRKKGTGELRIQFFSLDEFDGLMQQIGFKGTESHLTV